VGREAAVASTSRRAAAGEAPEGGDAVVAEEHGVAPLTALDLAEVQQVADVLSAPHKTVVGRRAPPQVHVRRGRVRLVGLEVDLEQELCRRGRHLLARKCYHSGDSQQRNAGCYAEQRAVT